MNNSPWIAYFTVNAQNFIVWSDETREKTALVQAVYKKERLKYAQMSEGLEKLLMKSEYDGYAYNINPSLWSVDQENELAFLLA